MRLFGETVFWATIASLPLCVIALYTGDPSWFDWAINAFVVYGAGYLAGRIDLTPYN